MIKIRIGNFLNQIAFEDIETIPRPLANFINAEMMPAYSAFSQKTSKLEGQSNQGDVVFMNYGRMEDYEDLLRQGGNIQETLKNDIIIARYRKYN